MAQVFSECFVMNVNVGPMHSPRHEDRIDIGDVSEQVSVGVYQPQLGIVFLTLLVVIVGSIDNDRLSLQIKAKIRSDNDACIV